MGDAENGVTPSKKRAAGRELTRDTPLDDEEDGPELAAGTFKRASDEVLATRRIVKVRRQQTNPAASSNPFAGIRLVAHTESSANPGEATTETQKAGVNTTADDSKGSDGITRESEKAKDEEGKQPETESKTHEVEDQSAANKDDAAEDNAVKEHEEKENSGDKFEVDGEQSKDGGETETKDKKDAGDKESASEVYKEQSKDDNNTENKDTKDDKVESEGPSAEGGKNSENNDKKNEKDESEEPTVEGGSLKSFQQLSNSQNAFTGLAGTGFSSSLFSFGSMSNDGSSLGSRSGSIFGLKNDKPLGLGLSTNGSSGFGASGASVVSKSDGSSLSTLKEVVVETGEENEKVVFNADSVLFEFVDGSWKERGKGELKVNVSSETTKARLLMRSRGNYRLILNARLYPDMKLANMDKKGVTFACMNSATEGKDGLSTFALKFKDGSIVENFKAAVMAHKGEASTALKTPENSPKAADA